MIVHEFGEKQNPILLLLPGTMCYWKGNFGQVIETEIHVFYAKKMGEKYLARYKKYFRVPIVHEQDLRHEELLGVYPNEWCALVETICLR